MNINKLVDTYYLSSDFSMLTDKTKADYSNCLAIMLGTKVDNKSVWQKYILLKCQVRLATTEPMNYWLGRGVYYG
jgi:hypothetical protein